MRQLFLAVVIVVANSALTSLVWRLMGVRRREFHFTGRILAALFLLVNGYIAVASLVHLWKSGSTWFWTLMLLQALVFAFRMGGAASRGHP